MIVYLAVDCQNNFPVFADEGLCTSVWDAEKPEYWVGWVAEDVPTPTMARRSWARMVR
jgi:hypothetical protein